ncbi:fdxN element excision recombinase XisF [Nostoc sp. FACHB-145]|uniref:fdxN element excision recombinase XisF n=1 Tax=Nostoc sp. FACHB-145 TaxID=2692836 RepID=UPI001687FF1A|nr:fdxN element excision recombinase XisF [Nostoc sp. FACHB-145]MBD2473066.1 recombinase family protein [Nostoc sp. FACHB-145]
MNSTLVKRQISARILIRYFCLPASERGRFYASVKDFILKNYQQLSATFSDIYAGVLCILNSNGLCTKMMIELANNPPNSFINIQEEMERLDIGYARVSSREQAEDTNALNQQIERLKDAGAQYILSDVEKGKNDERPQYQKLMRLVEARRVGTLFITRIDRITRSLPTLRKIIDTLQKYDVNLIILDQKLDLSTPQGKLTLNMLGVLAEWEVDLLSDRIKKGKEHQRKQNWANGSCPFGLIVIERKYFLDTYPFLCLLTDRPENYRDFYSDSIDGQTINDLPHRTVADIARDCIEIFLEAKGIVPTLQKIFDKYGISKTQAKSNGTDKVLHWSKRGFSLWIQNPTLDGHTCYGKYEQTADGKRRLKPRHEWQIIRDTHPDQRLLRDGEAEEIQHIIEANIQFCSGAFGNKHRDEQYRPYAYQIGLVYCGECGCRCTHKGVYTSSKQYRYYACRHAGVGCNNSQNVKQPDIEQALITTLLEKSQNLSQGLADGSDEAAFKSERLQKLEAQLAYLKEFPGFNPSAEEFKAELERQIEEETNFFQSQRLEDKTVEEIIHAGNNLGIWRTLSSNDKVSIYRRIVQRIFIRNGQVESIMFKNSSSDGLETKQL